ncbi:MAG: type IV secretion system DNA-binding domain-containing protein [Clostridiales bacterium]|nr:type IV secretion system DNA-binding domain-containing protein [Clostridiales bacterium]
MKKLIEGAQLLENVPKNYHATGVGPTVRLAHGLTLDDGNCFHGPLLIEGKVGSGKTFLLKQMMDAILTYAETVGDNAVVFCAKRELLCYRPGDVVIDISSTAPACCWNIFAELQASENPDLTLREISSALFSEQMRNTLQQFFPQAAQDIFVKTCNYFNDYGKRNGVLPSNGDLVEFFETTPIWGDEKIPGWLDLAESHAQYFSCVRDYIGQGSEQGLGVLSELRTLISSTLYGSFASYNGTFSAINALKSGGKRIFLYYDYANAGHSTLSVVRVILDLLLKQAMNASARNKTWFFLDEASLLPRSDVLTDALSLGRDPSSNGMGGVRIIMALQSARLMSHHYTQQEAETLLSLFPNVIALQVADPMSRAIVSERYGKAHYQYSYAGIGEKIHYTDSFEDVVSDFHFSCLTKKGKAIMSLPSVCENPFFYDGYQEGRT